jgi:hypothetical protein
MLRVRGIKKHIQSHIASMCGPGLQVHGADCRAQCSATLLFSREHNGDVLCQPRPIHFVSLMAACNAIRAPQSPQYSCSGELSHLLLYFCVCRLFWKSLKPLGTPYVPLMLLSQWEDALTSEPGQYDSHVSSSLSPVRRLTLRWILLT